MVRRQGPQLRSLMYDKAQAADGVMRSEAAESHQGQEHDRSSNRPDRFVHPAPPIPTGSSCGGRRDRHLAEERERGIVPVAERFGGLRRIGPHEAGIAVRQVHREEVARRRPDDGQEFTWEAGGSRRAVWPTVRTRSARAKPIWPAIPERRR